MESTLVYNVHIQSQGTNHMSAFILYNYVYVRSIVHYVYNNTAQLLQWKTTHWIII